MNHDDFADVLTAPTLKVIKTEKVGKGTYALTEKDKHGYHELWKLHNKVGYMAGLVANAENMLAAIDNAEEEMRAMIGELADEFGL